MMAARNGQPKKGQSSPVPTQAQRLSALEARVAEQDRKIGQLQQLLAQQYLQNPQVQQRLQQEIIAKMNAPAAQK